MEETAIQARPQRLTSQAAAICGDDVLEMLHLVPLLVVPVQRLAMALTLSQHMYLHHLETLVQS